MAEIKITDVVKEFPNGFKAIRSVNLNLADGEFMVLVGPSGWFSQAALPVWGEPLLDSVKEHLTNLAAESSVLRGADLVGHVVLGSDYEYLAPLGARQAALRAFA